MGMAYRGVITTKDNTAGTVNCTIPYLSPRDDYGPMSAYFDVASANPGDAIWVLGADENSSEDFVALAVLGGQVGGGGGGSGDFSSSASVSVDGEIVLYSGTTGKLAKRATTTGVLKAAAGVLAAAVQGTDYWAPGGTDVAIADGGTGASSASAARTNLGLGSAALNATTDFAQVANNLSDLASVATARTNLGLGTIATHPVGDFAQTANNLSDLASATTARTNLGLGSSATHAATDFLQAANNLSDVANQATARSNLGLVIGTTVEAHDADLTTIAGLTPTNNDTLQYISGAWANRTTSQVKTTLAIVPGDISGFDTQVRTSTLNQMAAPTADLSINSHKLTSVTDPTSAQDAATKNYVDTKFPDAAISYHELTSQQSYTSTTTLANVTDLAASVVATGTYLVEAFIMYEGSTTGDLKIGWSGPASATFEWYSGGLTSGASTQSASLSAGYKAIGDTVTVGGVGTGTANACVAVVKGILKTNGTSGTFQFRAAQGGSDATATLIYVRSYLKLERVA